MSVEFSSIRTMDIAAVSNESMVKSRFHEDQTFSNVFSLPSSIQNLWFPVSICIQITFQASLSPVRPTWPTIMVFSEIFDRQRSIGGARGRGRSRLSKVTTSRTAINVPRRGLSDDRRLRADPQEAVRRDHAWIGSRRGKTGPLGGHVVSSRAAVILSLLLGRLEIQPPVGMLSVALANDFLRFMSEYS